MKFEFGISDDSWKWKWHKCFIIGLVVFIENNKWIIAFFENVWRRKNQRDVSGPYWEYRTLKTPEKELP